MKAKGLSTIALAKQVGCHRTFISHVLAGRRIPSWRYLERIAEALEVPPELLYRLLRDQQRGQASA
jgi:transcriptional regulator with XRE-family HTH domain